MIIQLQNCKLNLTGTKIALSGDEDLPIAIIKADGSLWPIQWNRIRLGFRGFAARMAVAFDGMIDAVSKAGDRLAAKFFGFDDGKRFAKSGGA